MVQIGKSKQKRSIVSIARVATNVIFYNVNLSVCALFALFHGMPVNKGNNCSSSPIEIESFVGICL